jgi:hypothetical protein
MVVVRSCDPPSQSVDKDHLYINHSQQGSPFVYKNVERCTREREKLEKLRDLLDEDSSRVLSVIKSIEPIDTATFT